MKGRFMKETLASEFEKLFGEPAQIFAQAPGRIEFIGNHTDYNGGYVMGVAIDKTIMCALSRRDDRKLCFGSIKKGEKVFVDLDRIVHQPRSHNWVNYPLGVVKFLIEAGMKPDCGFNMLDISSLPAGAGLSSSAAIELCTAMGVSKLYNFDTDLKTLIRVSRRSENEFLGMPSGILDQGTSGFGKANSIVFIDCLTEEFSTLPLPDKCRFWIFNSTKKHALVDGLYAERHNECAEAARILSEDGEPRLLRAFSMTDLEAAKMKMSDVVYRRAKHVICENDRVLKTKELLEKGDIKGVGDMLYASHESSRALFENSAEELDFLVAESKNYPSIYGARLSGGGFGGAVMALTDETFDKRQAEQIARAYENRFGKAPTMFSCAAGDGAKLA